MIDADRTWFAHYDEVPAGSWAWPHFQPREVACHGSASLLISTPALDTLERMRVAVGRPMILLSAYRSEAHNAIVGGAALSEHLLGHAFDIELRGHDRSRLTFEAAQAGFTGFGYYGSFLHVDTGRRRSWGSWN